MDQTVKPPGLEHHVYRLKARTRGGPSVNLDSAKARWQIRMQKSAREWKEAVMMKRLQVNILHLLAYISYS